MKLRYKEEKYILHSLKVARKKSKRRKIIKKYNLHLRKLKLNKSRSYLPKSNKKKRFETIYAPKILSLIKEPDVFSVFISEIETVFNKKRGVFINMDNVEDIDYSALSALLAVMYMFKQKHYVFNGSFPKEIKLAERIRKCGFLYHLFENHSKTNYSLGEYGMILTQEDEVLDPSLIANLIKEVSKKIWTTNKRCPGMNNIIQELIDNTKQHASGNKDTQKRWWLSVNYDEINNKVSFVFIDYGIGVFKSLAVKPMDSIWAKKYKYLQQKFGVTNNHEHLRDLVSSPTRETSTGRKGRGLGLYGINKIMKRNHISNLYIITNNAYGNISNNDFNLINKGFNGTLVCWELCYNNKYLEPL